MSTASVGSPAGSRGSRSFIGRGRAQRVGAVCAGCAGAGVGGVVRPTLLP